MIKLLYVSVKPFWQKICPISIVHWLDRFMTKQGCMVLSCWTKSNYYLLSWFRFMYITFWKLGIHFDNFEKILILVCCFLHLYWLEEIWARFIDLKRVILMQKLKALLWQLLLEYSIPSLFYEQNGWLSKCCCCSEVKWGHSYFEVAFEFIPNYTSKVWQCTYWRNILWKKPDAYNSYKNKHAPSERTSTLMKPPG